MRIYLIRHLKTKGNLERCYIGTTDESLLFDPACRETVQKLRSKIGEVEYVAGSPLKRCRQTAEMIFPGMSYHENADFRECDFGDFENKNYEELKDVPAYQAWLDSGGTIPFPNGESHIAFCERCAEAFENEVNILTERQIEKAAFVVHGGTIMAILEKIDSEGQGFYHWQLPNGGCYCTEIDERRSVWNIFCL